MALITFPTSYAAREIRVFPESVVAVSRSPFTKQTQIYDYDVQIWHISFQLVPKKGTDAAEWTQFITDLKGQLNTFNFDLFNYVPHLPNPSTTTFRLKSNQVGWNKNKNGFWMFDRFEAIQAL
jgi:hypothetical protein